MTLRRAIVCPPPSNFADGLTTARLGRPNHELALAQHRQYCAALEQCGLSVIRLDPDPAHPDSPFVEDVAVLTPRCAILTRPGAPSRQGEVAGVRNVISALYSPVLAITTPGTVDGGDVCEADNHFFIGISSRTNEDGARQLAGLLAERG